MTLTVLGIESSCDDTAAAVVRLDDAATGGGGDAPRILSSVVAGQETLHAAFGGVVPEIAARAHAERLDLAVEQALAEAAASIEADKAAADPNADAAPEAPEGDESK